jgi:hypothetical protein
MLTHHFGWGAPGGDNFGPTPSLSPPPQLSPTAPSIFARSDDPASYPVHALNIALLSVQAVFFGVAITFRCGPDNYSISTRPL